MLVLSRKPGQSIMIGSDIKIVVHRMNGNRVSLAIVAPKHVHILRGELEEKDPPAKKPDPDPVPANA